mmetsp:Transcript_37629/g.97293  ORF Transcript_37629/g.97293 Transcript_37629/m.97293 type:complete len:262 (+) Transcript_37629:1439-2224(+)
MQVAVLVVGGREEVAEAVEDVRERRPGAGLAHRNAARLPVHPVVPRVEPLVLVLALAVGLDLDAVEHGLAVDPVHELVVAELELGRPRVDPAAAQPRGEVALDPEAVHLDLLLRRLQPSGEVDADLVRALRAIERVHVRDQPRSFLGRHSRARNAATLGRGLRCLGIRVLEGTDSHRPTLAGFGGGRATQSSQAHASGAAQGRRRGRAPCSTSLGVRVDALARGAAQAAREDLLAGRRTRGARGCEGPPVLEDYRREAADA